MNLFFHFKKADKFLITKLIAKIEATPAKLKQTLYKGLFLAK